MHARKGVCSEPVYMRLGAITGAQAPGAQNSKAGYATMGFSNGALCAFLGRDLQSRSAHARAVS